MSCLKNFQTLKSGKAFAWFYNHASKKYVTTAVIFYKAGKGRRVGFTASKKIGNAVARNFAKRRLRAAFLKLSDKLEEGTYIFVAKKEILDADFKRVEQDMRYALKKLGALNTS